MRKQGAQEIAEVKEARIEDDGHISVIKREGHPPRLVHAMKTIDLAPIKPTISLDTLEKIDIRVGTIESVEEVPGSDKLVKLSVDFGNHKRTIVAAMLQERQNPKEVTGKQALFVVNLEPKKMMGTVSQGMLFDIGYADGLRPVLAIPESQVPNGTRAG